MADSEVGEVLVRSAVEAGGAVRTITLDRPAKRNALNAAMLAQLQALFTVEPPAGERVTVIRAEGPAFCAGVALVEAARQSDDAREGIIARLEGRSTTFGGT